VVLVEPGGGRLNQEVLRGGEKLLFVQRAELGGSLNLNRGVKHLNLIRMGKISSKFGVKEGEG